MREVNDASQWPEPDSASDTKRPCSVAAAAAAAAASGFVVASFYAEFSSTVRAYNCVAGKRFARSYFYA